MPFPNPDTQFKPGQSGNPEGKPKGTKHLSSWIKELLDDEEFQVKLEDGTLQKVVPIRAIILTAVHKALDGDHHAREWLAKYGWGTRLEVEIDDKRDTEDKIKGFLDASDTGDDLQHDSQAADPDDTEEA